MKNIDFIDKYGTFRIKNPENYSGLYLPLAGEMGLKSSITPTLGGDSKTSQNTFLLEPVSIENLHNNKGTRNFWCRIVGKGFWSVCGSSAQQEADRFTGNQDESELEAGLMWQKLHGADWNDALDMAWDKGESVAFTCAYAGNLLDIAKCLRDVEKVSGISKIEVLKELEILLADDETLYNSPDQKQELLMSYAKECENCTSGSTVLVSIAAICENLEHKAEWMMKNIRENEWIADGTDGGWFNGYYDNNGRPVERCEHGDVRMMLTGQVFAIMSGTAKKEQIKAICNSADKYLFDEKAGGYRLNTDFKEEKFDLGRMFGFAYGEKENGAVFSHMAVMYANALYKQGFTKEGYKVLKTLLDTAMDFDRSRMYPGVPEYFDNDGRGLYSYLTGAASWYMLTMITSVYGVHGELGDLVIEPALMPQQYNENGDAKVSLEFAGHGFDILVHNPDRLEPGDAQVKRALCDDVKVENVTGNSVRISKHAIEMLSTDKCHTVEIYIE